MGASSRAAHPEPSRQAQEGRTDASAALSVRRLRYPSALRQDQVVLVLRVLWQVLLPLLPRLAAVLHSGLCDLLVRLPNHVRGEQEGKELLGEDLQRAAHYARESQSESVS